MYAVVGMVEIEAGRQAEAQTALTNVVMPQVKQAPGFVSGTWMRSADGKNGRSVVIFESEDAAKAALEQAQQGPPPGVPVKFISADIFEVMAQA